MKESAPKLKKVGENEAGYPIYERVAEPSAEANDEYDIELDNNDRKNLRNVLAAIGITLVSAKMLDEASDTNQYAPIEDQVVSPTQTHSAEPVSTDYIVAKETTETIGQVEAEATFESEQEGYKALVNLRHDEIQFVDEFNRPVGEVQRYEEFTDEKPEYDGLYLYKPGVLDESGILKGDLATEWIDYVKERVQKDHSDQKIVDTLHVEEDFQKALAEDDEPELVTAIKNGEIVRYVDIVNYFAQKPVNGAENFSRQEYVSEMIEFTGIPEIAETELRRLLPSLCAQESKYNAGVVSPSGAVGIMQIKPKTWWAYTHDHPKFKNMKEQEKAWQKDKDSVVVSTSLIEQVEVAGKFISDMYYRIPKNIGEEAMSVFRSKFISDDDFIRDFMVPLVINAYNVGETSMYKTVRQFYEELDKEAKSALPSGKELFLTIANYAESANGAASNYKEEAREYVPRIYAQAEVLNKTDHKNNRIASTE